MTMREPGSFNQFVMMFYKGMLLKKRHYILATLQFLYPVLIISIPVMILSSTVGPSTSSFTFSRRHNETVYPLFSPFTSNSFVDKQIFFMYTPNTEMAGHLINKSIELWLEKTIKSKRSIAVNYTRMGYDKESELNDAAMAELASTAIVLGTVFQNFPSSDSKPMPHSLLYKIRYGDSKNRYLNFHTDSLFELGTGPRSDNVYKSTFFLSWQTSVEQSFINIRTETKKVDYAIMMQRHPYPPYEDVAPGSISTAMLPIFISQAFAVYFCFVVGPIVDEKMNRSKELLKMMGMSDFVYWSSTFVNSFITGFLVVSIATILYTAKLSNGQKVLTYSDPFLIFVILLLCVICMLLFTLAITTFCPRPIFAVVLVIVLFSVISSLVQVYLFPVTGSAEKFLFMSATAKLAICLIPQAALQAIFKSISLYEGIGEGLLWRNLTDMSLSPGFNVAQAMAMMLVSCLLFCIIIWYVDAVWPWQPGVPKPPHFFFTRSYWFQRKRSTTESEILTEVNSNYFEDVSHDITPGVQIQGISKDFKVGSQTKMAVDNVSLKIYSGQITCLLGRNGAGKTTLINILTGLFKSTKGSAFIHGWDIDTHTRKARASMGICPQENILYDSLTVQEHLKLYAGMKGVPRSDLNAQSAETMKMLGLEQKKNELSKNLSGGMKRKLSLGIALIGDSKVLFLDEPTSGMDPEARRFLWDLLLRIRHDKTIILTTHYMEEADILGDRIAIMANGEMRCCGSSLFLKRLFGTGYHLHMVKLQSFKPDEVAKVLHDFVPDAVSEELENEVSYVFSGSTSGDKLGQMFQILETNKDQLGISSFGLTVTTMDDVFLKVTVEEEVFKNMDVNNHKISTETVSSEVLLLPKPKLLLPFELWCNRMASLIIKRFHYTTRFFAVLILQLLLPFGVLCMLLNNVASSTRDYSTAPPELRLNLKSTYGNTESFYNLTNVPQPLVETYVNLMLQMGSNVEQKNNPQDYVLGIGKTDLNMYLKRLLVGCTSEVRNLTDTINLRAWYNGEPFHVLPMSLSLTHSAVLRYYTVDSSASIEVTNAPFPSVNLITENSQFETLAIRLQTSLFVPMALAFFSASYIIVPIHEFNSRAKLLQLMTGLSPFTYWFATLIWDMFLHVVVSAVLLIPFVIFMPIAFAAQPQAMGGAYLIYLLFGWCLIPICYLMSRLFQKPSNGFTLIVLLNIITGLIFSCILVISQLTTSADNVYVKIMVWFFRIFPSFSATWSFGTLVSISYENSLCDRVPKTILEYMCKTSEPSLYIVKCCEDLCQKTNTCFKKVMPLSWSDNTCGADLMFLGLAGFVAFSLLIFWETSLPSRILSLINSVTQRLKPIATLTSLPFEPDSDVQQEVQKIQDMGTDLTKLTDRALVTMDLKKVYKNICAVNKLTFGIRHQECFGLLGVNGAGKTSTFKMLTGDILPTSGDAFMRDCSLRQNLKQFQPLIGYCPQYDALIDRLTGRETLQLFAALRGVPIRETRNAINSLMHKVDLQEHADKQTKFYSGGSKRKLSLAIALIGSPPVVLLDEPTAGVDPVSRRKIWSVLSEIRQANSSCIVLSSHSMEECEAICNRLAIMVNGQLRCLGTIQHLKAKFGQGYSVFIKLKKEHHNAASVDLVRLNFMSKFPRAKLQDDNQGMLQFHIDDTTMRWSELFTSLEEIKQSMDLEDYLIGGTTLEQIFLAFARTQIVVGEHK